MSSRRVPLGTVCSQDRTSVRPGHSDELPYLGLEGIESGTGRFVEGNLSKTPEVPQANSFRFDERHVLYGKLRPYLNKVALPTEPGKCSTEIIPLLPSTQCDRQYLSYFLRAPSTVQQISERSAGARMPRADMDFVLSLPIPLPLIDEQRRLVDLLSRAEGIVRLRRQAQQKAATLIPAIFVDMFGDPATNPNRWPLHQLSDLLADTKLGLVRGAKEMGSGLAYPYLRMDAVGSGYVQLRGLRRVDACPKEVADYSLKEGDFLLNTRNSRELVGKTGVVAAEPPESTLFNNNLMRMRFHKDVVLPLFVNWQFQTDHVQRQLDSIKRGTTTVFAVYYKDLKNLQLVVPAIDRQRQFSERATQILRIQQQQREATEKAEAAFGALLARSFCGAAAPAAVPSEEATEA